MWPRRQRRLPACSREAAARPPSTSFFFSSIFFDLFCPRPWRTLLSSSRSPNFWRRTAAGGLGTLPESVGLHNGRMLQSVTSGARPLWAIVRYCSQSSSCSFLSRKVERASRLHLSRYSVSLICLLYFFLITWLVFFRQDMDTLLKLLDQPHESEVKTERMIVIPFRSLVGKPEVLGSP